MGETSTAVEAPGGLARERLERMFVQMHQIRFCEEKVAYFFSRGMVHGTTHLYVGEEATAVGAIAALGADDLITSTHRGHGHTIAKGIDLNAMMAELLGRRTGSCKGKGGSMHIADLTNGNLGANGVVGGGIPIAVGAGLSLRLLKQDRVVVCFFGDGASNEGTFHEAINLASVWNLPVIFLCENNQYGMSMSVKRSHQRVQPGRPGQGVRHPRHARGRQRRLRRPRGGRDRPGARAEGGPLPHRRRDLPVPGALEERRQQVPHEGRDRALARPRSDTPAAQADGRERPLHGGGARSAGGQAKVDIDRAVEFAIASPEPELDDLFTDVYAD